MQKFKRIDQWIRNLEPVNQLGVLLLTMSIGLGMIGYVKIHGSFDFLTFLNDYYANISTELGSIAITVLVIDYFARRRDKWNETENLKASLKREMGSEVNSVVTQAVEELRHLGYLEDGTLKGVNLINADLTGCKLDNANLEDALLLNTKLNDAHLFDVNLYKASMSTVKLTNATLLRSNLQNTTLMEANLENTDLCYADLRGANLSDAILMNAQLIGTKFDETTILPDRKNWSHETDVRRFTHPNYKKTETK